jgi:hypothetical protein
VSPVLERLGRHCEQSVVGEQGHDRVDVAADPVSDLAAGQLLRS